MKYTERVADFAAFYDKVAIKGNMAGHRACDYLKRNDGATQEEIEQMLALIDDWYAT